jgi:hypothetical protein
VRLESAPQLYQATDVIRSADTAIFRPIGRHGPRGPRPARPASRRTRRPRPTCPRSRGRSKCDRSLPERGGGRRGAPMLGMAIVRFKVGEKEEDSNIKHEVGRRVAHHLRGLPRPGIRLCCGAGAVSLEREKQ